MTPDGERLRAHLLEDRGDAARWAVWLDWLQESGHPLAREADVALPIDRRMSATFYRREGVALPFVERLDNHNDRTPQRMLKAVCEHPAFGLLRELQLHRSCKRCGWLLERLPVEVVRLGTWCRFGSSFDGMDAPNPFTRRLSLAQSGRLAVGDELARRFPRLRALELHFATELDLAGLQLDRLELRDNCNLGQMGLDGLRVRELWVRRDYTFDGGIATQERALLRIDGLERVRLSWRASEQLKDALAARGATVTHDPSM